MTVHVPAPGSIRTINFYAKPDAETGRYPVTYWGSLDEQIAEATAANARATSSLDHTQMPLYTRTEDCPHANPEDQERFDGVDDLIDEWMNRNAPGLTWRDGDLFHKNQKRAHVSVPLYVEWKLAQDSFDDIHSGTVCLDEPMGSCCTECTEGDEDFGFEPEGCRLAENVREAYDDFWYLASEEAAEERARKKQT